MAWSGQAEAATVGHGHLSQCHNVPGALWSLVMGAKAGEQLLPPRAPSAVQGAVGGGGESRRFICCHL